MPSPGWPVLAALGAWCLWSLLSLARSIDPADSQTPLEREIGDTLVVMLVFYIAARDARSFRTLAAAALASFAVLAALAIGIDFFTGSWDAGRYHHGVGPWSTLSVLVAPLLFALVAPPTIGFANGARSIAAGLALVAMLVVTDRMTDNRIVWIALAAVFGIGLARSPALRWPRDVRAHADALDQYLIARDARRARHRVHRRRAGAGAVGTVHGGVQRRGVARARPAASCCGTASRVKIARRAAVGGLRLRPARARRRRSPPS